MPKREKEDIQRIHLWIFKRDYERLKFFYGDTTGISKIVRQVLHDYLNHIEAKATAKFRPLDKREVDLDD